MKVQEALKSAIETLEKAYIKESEHPWCKKVDETISLCKSALSDIEKCEPVAWIYGATLATKHKYNHVYLGDIAIPQPEWQPLYTSPISKECEPINEVYAFEKWLKENTLIRASLNIDLDYADPLAEIAYRAWKARAKLNTPEKG